MAGDEIEAVDQLTDRVIAVLLERGVDANADLVNDLVAALLNAPVNDEFLLGVKTEALFQRSKWGSEHDAGKAPEDWFWLLGYLAGKALHAAKSGDRAKALHHTISSGAALLNWHAHMLGESTTMRPGIEPPELDAGEEDAHRCRWCGLPMGRGRLCKMSPFDSRFCECVHAHGG